MLTAPLLFALVAQPVLAADPGVVAAPEREGVRWGFGPVIRPRFSLGAMNLSGRSVPRLALGGDLGLRYAHQDVPPLFGHTRVSYVHTWALEETSTGHDLAIGTFAGLDWEHLAFQTGPDLRFNTFGDEDSVAYQLPASWGLGWVVDAEFRANRTLALLVELTPAWLLNPERHRADIGPWDELTVQGALRLRVWRLQLVLGYERWLCVAGDADRFLFSIGLAPKQDEET